VLWCSETVRSFHNGAGFVVEALGGAHREGFFGVDPVEDQLLCRRKVFTTFFMGSSFERIAMVHHRSKKRAALSWPHRSVGPEVAEFFFEDIGTHRAQLGFGSCKVLCVWRSI
jgi:hypothetical protein